MNYYIFFFGLFLLFSSSLIVGFFSKSKNDTQNEYFLANKNISLIPLSLTFAATQIGGGIVIGTADEAFHYGPFALLYSIGQFLGLIILGFCFSKLFRKLNVATIAEIFEKRYGSIYLKKFASFISIISLTGILISMAVSSRKFIKSIGIENEYILIIFWSILILYTVMGGMNAVVNTDILQVCILMIFLIIGLCVMLKTDLEGLKQVLKESDFKKEYILSKNKLFGWIFIPVCFMLIEQDMAQRCFSGKSTKTVRYSCLIGAILIFFVSVISATFGIIARSIPNSIDNVKSIFLVSVINKTNPIISALVGCAILSAIISTADSILLAISSNICQDFNIDNNEKKKIIKAKIITALIGIISLFGAFFFKNVLTVLVYSYELSVYCILVPLLTSTIFSNIKFKSYTAWLSIFGGIIGFCIFKFLFQSIIFKEALMLLISISFFYLGFKIQNKTTK